MEMKVIEIGNVNGRKSFFVFVYRWWEKRKLDVLELGIKLVEFVF